MSEQTETVTLTIDGVQVTVPKGTNLIEAARQAGIEIPYYCYHPGLSVAGNCRMCQVQVEGMRKLTIGCNTTATEGMVVRTQRSSEEVAEAQRATLEFLLINHPLDCTVCDAAGHCKLQDYYYEYNSRASRFIEDKVNKVKAEPVGPEVIYDGERCIVCTRCVRFCDEVTGTSEFGVFNRGDRSVIGIYPGKELTNPLSGSVVDLCPVGALTHRRWRFNTRIWYTKQKETICTGCSTGCNAKVAVRDGKIVYVKARPNSKVNQEWMCDEGRYGFDRFQPERRLTNCYVRQDGSLGAASWEDAFAKAGELLRKETAPDRTAVFLSPFLTLEEMWLAVLFAESRLGVPRSSGSIAVQLRRRTLTEVEAVLISPDYAPNARSAQLLGLIGPGEDWREAVERRYADLVERVRSGAVDRVIVLGEGAVLNRDVDPAFRSGLAQATCRIVVGADADWLSSLGASADIVLAGRTVNERSGVMLNGTARFQRVSA
ncbi:MAG: (2Fe-2S)-binding protein, partial [Bdellovibrionales bacterium]|nr:(2Fe-2S)-binding protein [Bdellovibrionales bacterium]